MTSDNFSKVRPMVNFTTSNTFHGTFLPTIVNRTLLSQQRHQNIEGVNGQLQWNVGEEATTWEYSLGQGSQIGGF
jgi:hypothetical protein